MKKIVAFIVTLILVVSMCVTVYANTIGTGSQEIDVEGRYQDNTVDSTVYSVDVTWGTMQFTYTESGTMTWNPADHTYSDNIYAGWTADGNTVTVTNHSNAAVTASFSFNALSNYDTISGSFDIPSDTLDSGVGNDYESADTVTATLTLTGTLDETVTDYTRIGVITVKIDS